MESLPNSPPSGDPCHSVPKSVHHMLDSTGSLVKLRLEFGKLPIDFTKPLPNSMPVNNDVLPSLRTVLLSSVFTTGSE